jgi:hypothetical protein
MRDVTTLTSSFLAVAGGLILGTSSLAAQSDRPRDPRTPPAVTWCEKPAPRTTWKRQPVSFMLDFAVRDSSGAQRILTPYLPFLLGGIADAYVAQWQPSRTREARTVKDLPPGEPRYGPANLVEPSVQFDLLGNWRVDSITVTDTTGSLLAADLKAALEAAASRGDVFGPYADSSVRTRLELTAGLGEWRDFPSWLAFSLYAPVTRGIRADHRNPTPGYPPEGLGWEGKLVFQYLVNEEGRAVPETAKVLGGENVEWKSERYRAAYESFRSRVIASLARMRYTPQEHLGCVTPGYVQQEFVFTMKSGPAIP